LPKWKSGILDRTMPDDATLLKEFFDELREFALFDSDSHIFVNSKDCTGETPLKGKMSS